MYNLANISSTFIDLTEKSTISYDLLISLTKSFVLKVVFGKFLSDIEVLAVKNSQGQHVFENSDEVRVPAYMLYAVPEKYHLLIRKALYLAGKYDVELLIVPNTEEIKEDAEVRLTSEQIEDFIDARTKTVDVAELPTIEDAVTDQNNEQNTENNE